MAEEAIHLSRAAASLPLSCNISQLKSHLLWVSSITSGVNDSTMCPKCCQVWVDGKFTYKLKSTATPGPRMVKILRKGANMPDKLNRVEKSLLQRYKKNVRNKLVLQCLVCHSETVFKNKKHEPPQLEKHIQTPAMDAVTPILCKKKKKKDRFAGLNVSAVLSVTPSPAARSLKKIKNSPSSEPLATKSVDRQQQYPSTPRIPNSMYCTPRPQVNLKSVKKEPLTGKAKMKSLRQEVMLQEQNMREEQKKALSTMNINIKKKNKLQNYLNKAQKDIQLEDRISSLLC